VAYVRGVSTSDVEVRRSRRRRRTVSAYREDGRTVVLIPARFTKAEERQWVATMLDRLAAGDRRRSPSDAELTVRADELSRRYLGGLAKPVSIRWVDNQQTRWGSCTPADGTIRISTRVRGMPGYVLDYVVLHELAHLIVPGHGKDFWSLVSGFPRMDRARGYLEGVAATAGLDLAAGPLADDEVAEQDGIAALEFGSAE
jgi:predicted metal-dependent hydrolase